MAKAHGHEPHHSFSDILSLPWLRYPIFAMILATLLEVGTLVGAPLSSPLVLSDWEPLRWVIFFFVGLLVAIPLFGSLDGGSATRLLEWITCDGARNCRILLATTVGAVVVGWLAAWAFAAIGLHADMSGDGRPSAIFGILCAATVVLVVHHRVLFDHVEWGFLLVVLAIGISLQVALPPYANISADDRAHLNAAIGISYVMNPQVTPELQAVADASVSTSPWNPEEPASDALPSQEEVFRAILSWRTGEEARANLGGGEASEYVRQEGFVNALGGNYLSLNTIGRIPMACGLWVGRLFSMAPYAQLVMARVANLLFYAWITWVAIRTLRNGKLILLLVALFPPIVMLAANLSYDPWIISMVFLGVARFAKVMQTDGAVLDTRNGLRILVPLFLGVIVKAVYFPILLLPLLAPKSKRDAHGHRAKLVWYVVGASLSLVLLVAMPMVLTGGASNTDTGFSQDASSMGQIAYVLQHPLRVARMYGRWLTEFLAADTLQVGLFANYLITRVSPEVAFALSGGPFSAMSVALLFLGPFGLRRDGDGAYRTVPIIVGTIVLGFSAFSLMAASLYVGYTSVGDQTIVGMQHRYIFPLLFPFLLFVPNANIVNRIRPRVMAGVVLCIGALLLLGQTWWAVFAWIG